MHSFTSSSSFSISRVPVTKLYALPISLTLVVAILGGMEFFWRSRGHAPTVTDSSALWAAHRAQARGNTVALLGNSRIQLGFSMDTFRARFPDRKVVQLAVDGRMPIATLRDLAHDDRFCGLVICDISERGFSREAWDQQEDYVAYFQNDWSLQHQFECVLATQLQNNFAVLDACVSPIQIGRTLVRERSLPKTPYLVSNPDRSRLANYSLVDLKKLQAKRLSTVANSLKKSPPDKKAWLQDVADVDRLVKRIQARGGQVVFILFPTSRELFQATDQGYPKKEFWDQMAARTSALTIHFKDIPELANFDCPDFSHLDRADSPRFTEELLNELVKRKVL